MAIKVTCPECEAVLKLPDDLPVGKKIRCPECSAVFVPKLAGAAKPKAKPVAVPPPPPPPPPVNSGSDEDDLNPYGVETEQELTESEKKAKAIHFGELRDKYPKSKRGPAIAKLVKPANYLVGAGMLVGLAAVVGFIWMMFPLVFNEGKAVSDEKMKQQLLYMGGFVLVGGYGALICLGASKMQNLESYPWAMAGGVLATPLLVGLMAVIVLRDPEVRAGFQEAPPPK
ncbi:zinc ribbon domain-containing protein [Tuwongella immobilis]|uniref:: zinc_ribbon_5: DUF3133 n=1 Tax=Tuwongella immobilis TaxID=692036 RepID=A0A6C2YRH5_9BACT|nr:hypothetical protein [Tuwongella immobilis]VIP03585.1 : zinc_ribbon_5: DUF3133 [Tuwongella immobilis]VTS04538.1 : zinc_ribbon_5: DUF3133 [Tuwongella immobilis]